MTTTMRMRHVARINPSTPEFDRLPDDAEVTFLPLEAVWPGPRLDTSRLRIKSEVAVGYTRFREGDILIPKITPTFEADRSTIASGLKDGVGAGTTELHIVRPSPTTDGRYLNYLVSSRMFLHGGEAEMIGVAGQKRVPDSWLRDLPVPVTELRLQRAVVRFLDVETTRIDTLIIKKRQMIALLTSRMQAWLDQFFRQAGAKYRLKRLLAQSPRYGVLVPVFVDDGVPFIRVNDIEDLEARASSLVRIDIKQSQEYDRSVVQAGDILVSVVGSIDKAAVAGPSVAGANIARAVARLTPNPDVPPELLAQWLKTKQYQDQARLATQSDTAQPTLNMSDLANFEVSFPRPEERQECLEVSREIILKLQILTNTLKCQVGLLQEHRQALITASVTGELEVPGVAS